jgi:hypothetical protein
MSTEFSQLDLDGEQQLGINLGSSEEGRQMGINPYPLSSPTIPNGGQQLGINLGSLDGGQQMEINPCPYIMRDDKWESTHVYQTYLLGACSLENSRQRMGQGLQNPLALGSHDHKKGVAIT